MPVQHGSSFRVQLVVWRRRKDRFCEMLVLFGVYPIPCLLLTWQGEEADGLGTTPNLLSFSTLLKGKQQERECIDVYLYDYYRPTRLGTISCSEKHKEHEALFNPAV